MNPASRHADSADAVIDGGDLDCGNGLLLMIRGAIDPLVRGQLLEVRSTEISVDEDLPAWCRLTGNDLVSWTKAGAQRSFLICKGALAERVAVVARASAPGGGAPTSAPGTARRRVVPTVAGPLPAPATAPAIPPLAIMGIGSWPRPRWMVQAIHDHLEGRLDDAAFAATGDDAVRLAVDAQHRAGVDVVTDGEQRRDSYASFVGACLDNCQLIPLTDLLPLVDDPEKLAEEFRALDVPASSVRHPAVFGPLGRRQALAGHELAFLKTATTQPVKVALPGPYLLTRIMFLECLTERAYTSREALARDVVRILRAELHHLLAAGAALVQFDEPVLTEVVHGVTTHGTSFMCGALSERGDPEIELAFARDLINEVVAGVPRERVAVHTCRGNWTRDEAAAMTGDYEPLLGTLATLDVGTLFLEMCTPRAGAMEILRALPHNTRIGIGVVNQKHEAIESVDAIARRIETALSLFGDRILLTPDCGFATFADNPVTSTEVAVAKLTAISRARARVLGR